MAIVLDATPGGVASNSFLTLIEAQAYFDTRLPITQWDNADSQTALLIMATRVMEAMFASAKRVLMRSGVGKQVYAYYRTSPTWTGSPATTTQALSWPRTGMVTRNGVTILSTVIPQELKNAVAELAGQLAIGDRTLDNDVIAQGITSIKAGSVALGFKNDFEFDVIPGAVWDLLVQSWLTDELIEPAIKAEFDVIGCKRSSAWGW